MAYQQEPKAFQEAFAEIQAVMDKHNFNGAILLCQAHPDKGSDYYFNRSMIVVHNEKTVFTKRPETPMNYVELMPEDKIESDKDGGLNRFKSSVRLLHGMIKAFGTLDTHFRTILGRLGTSEQQMDNFDSQKPGEQ